MSLPPIHTHTCSDCHTSTTHTQAQHTSTTHTHTSTTHTQAQHTSTTHLLTHAQHTHTQAQHTHKHITHTSTTHSLTHAQHTHKHITHTSTTHTSTTHTSTTHSLLVEVDHSHIVQDTWVPPPHSKLQYTNTALPTNSTHTPRPTIHPTPPTRPALLEDLVFNSQALHSTQSGWDRC